MERHCKRIIMKTRKVIVLPYDEAWASEFEKIKSEIEGALGDLVLAVEHVGSTSVKGLSAKPCIDIDVVIRDYSVFDDVVQRLNAIGYIHEGDFGIAGREAFKYSDKPHLMMHHLYVCPKDSEELRRHITFRDFLRNDAEASKKYGSVKEIAAKLYPNNIDKYIEYKSPCIKELYGQCGLRSIARGKMTNEEILKIAIEQSAADLCADASDFEKNDNVVVLSRDNKDARKYLKLPFSCQLVSYGNNVVASVSPEYLEMTEKYISKYAVEHMFETPNLHVLNEMLLAKGQKICFMAEYFLPDVNVLRPLDCEYELRILTPKDFAELYLPQWSNALCKDRRHLDVLGVGAYDNGKLVGLAGCSADCDTMWQIGIDVLPEYRRRGIASALTSRLALEILERGKVPFYCAAWCNVKSVRNAIKSGFRPAWVEMTAKPCETVDEMNK